jgi:hypothetical protein
MALNDTRSRRVSRTDRRTFIETTAVAAFAAATQAFDPREATAASPPASDISDAQKRQVESYRVRTDAAKAEFQRPLAPHPTNGDEQLYANKIGNYSKGLPHNALGEVDLTAYNSLLLALQTGDPADFERIQTGGAVKLVNPQSGLAFDMEGPDSHALTMAPAPALSSAEEAAEVVENYWMGLLRDVPFSQYGSETFSVLAAQELSSLSGFKGPKNGGRVDSTTLFRGNAPGTLTGPYISQFMWQDTPFGAERVDRQMRTAVPNLDYMTSYSDWLGIQNGAPPSAVNQYDATRRYVRNGRDLGEWVHNDVLYQAYFDALLILFSMNAPLDAGNPYNSSRTQDGFGTLGQPFFASVLGGIAARALKAVWYQKWFVHRRLRPEAYGGLLHNTRTGAARYSLHSDALNSQAVGEAFRRHGTYLLPMAFPEGCPAHPAYGAGHATVAGACVTVLKAFFDESFTIQNPVRASDDGLSRVPYSGPALTVGGELNKLAFNVALGRNIAGVHWRTDASESLKLGEELAIRYLREERVCLNEQLNGFSLTKFDGSQVTV